MQKLKILVYLILIIAFVIASSEGFDSNQKDAELCRSYFNESYSYYTEQLYWMQNGLCCRYDLVYGVIKEVCQDE